MIRTARVLVTLFFFTLVFDIAAHAGGKASAVREHQVPLDPRDDQRQPGQSLKATEKGSDEAHEPAPNPRIKVTTGHRRGEITPYHGRLCLTATAPRYSHVIESTRAQGSPWKAFADYAIKMFGRRRVFQMRFSLDLAATLA